MITRRALFSAFVAALFLKRREVKRSRTFSVDDICRVFRVPPHTVMELNYEGFNYAAMKSITDVLPLIQNYERGLRWPKSLGSV